MRVLFVLALVAAAAGLLLAGSGRGRPERPPAAAEGGEPPRERRQGRPPRRGPARCPAGAAGCVEARGRVLYVEGVDPDGDGDAHYVLAGGDVTAPGLTVVDVGARLRPSRLPRVGEEVSAAGPVYPGSYGQRQIEAIRVRHHGR